MTGATDPDDRRPFIWDTTRWNRTLLRTTIRLIALRKRTPVLRTGSVEGLLTDDAHVRYAFGRWQAGLRAVVVLNDDRYAHTYQIPVAPVEAPKGQPVGPSDETALDHPVLNADAGATADTAVDHPILQPVALAS